MDNTVDIKVKAGVSGQSEVQELAKTVRDLGAELGGKFEQEAKAAADALDALGAQKDAIATFQKLNNESGALAIEMAEVGTKVKLLEQELPQAAASISRLATAEAAAGAEARNAKRDLDEQRLALVTLREEFTGAARKTDAYKEANAQLQVSVREGRTYLRATEEALREVTQQTALAIGAEKQLATAYNEVGQAAATVRASVDANAAALAQQREQLRSTGIDASRLAEAERDLAAATAQAAQGGRDFITAQQATTRAIDEQVAALGQARQETVRAAEAQAAAVEKTRQATLAAEKAARDAAQTLKEAFSTVGVRSATELRAEITQVRAALDTVKTSGSVAGAELNRAMGVGNARIKALESDLRAVTGQLTLTDRAAGLFRGTMSQFAGGALIANGISALANKVQELGRAFIASNVQMETMRRGLGAVYGDAQTASAQIEFLRKTSQGAGISMAGIADSFVRFSAATKSSNIPLQVTNDLFAAVTRAGSTLGLSGARVTLVLDALGQMASKGVVSMEELRQQLGDSLPGALSTVAKGLGITDAQLIKLVESGQLAARDLFPALTKGLEGMQGSAATLTTKWESLKNALNTTATSAGDAGWTDVMRGGLDLLRVAAGLVVIPLVAIMEALFGIGRAAGVLVGAVTTLSNPLDSLKTIATDAGRRISAVGGAFFDSGEAAVKAAPKVTNYSAVIAAGTAAASANSGGQQAMAAATAVAGDASLSAAQKTVQLGLALERVQERAQQQVLLAEKSAKATETEGAALIGLARLRGDEVGMLNTAATAATTNAAALQNVAIARQAEAAALAVGLAEKVKDMKARGDTAAAIEQETRKLQDKAAAAAVDAQKAVEAAAAARTEAAERVLAAESYADNSKKIDEYRKALDTARQIESDYQLLLAQGVVTKETVQKKTEAVALAQGRLNDAVKDGAAASIRAASIAESKIRLDQAGLSLALQQAQAAESKARYDGNDYALQQSLIAQKEIGLKISRTKIELSEAEARSTLATAEATKTAAIADGSWNESKQAAYDLSLVNVKIKGLEAEGAKTLTDELERELKALKAGIEYQTDRTSGRERDARAMDSQTSAAQRLQNQNTSGGIGRSGRQSRGSGGGGGGDVDLPPGIVSKNGMIGFVDGDGKFVPTGDDNRGKGPAIIDPGQQIKSVTGNNREERMAGQNAVDANLQFLLRDKLNAGTTDMSDLAGLKAVAAALKQNAELDGSASRMSAGYRSTAGMADAQAWQATRARMEGDIERLERSAAEAANAARAPAPAPAPAAATASGATTSYVSNITLDSMRTRLNFADRDSQKGHEDLIRRILQDKGVAQ